MKLFRAVVIAALLVGPAYGQDHVPRYGEKDADKSASDIQADKAAAKAYKNSLSNIPDGAPADPWGNARAVTAPKVTAKPVAKTAAKGAAAKQARTGSTVN